MKIGMMAIASPLEIPYMEEWIEWHRQIGIDEFLRIRGDRTLTEILENFADCTSVAVNWRMYGSNGLEDVVNGDYSVVSRFRKCGRNLNHHVKQIVNVKKAVRQGNHFILPHCLEIPSIGIDGKGVFGPFNENGLEGAKELELAHYVVKSRQECRIRRTYRRADTGYVREEGWETFFKDNDINEIDDTEICSSCKTINMDKNE